MTQDVVPEGQGLASTARATAPRPIIPLHVHRRFRVELLLDGCISPTLEWVDDPCPLSLSDAVEAGASSTSSELFCTRPKLSVKTWAMSNRYRARIYPLVTGIWSWLQSRFNVLTCCTAAQTKSVPSVALSSPYITAFECFLGCLGQLIPSHRRRLDTNLALWGTEHQAKCPLTR